MNVNNSFHNSLNCLKHPLSLLSIFILLLNDHVLKTINPSWVTGKLSDLAGLFFFPFIIAAGLSFLLTKSKFTQRQIGQIAFILVIIWFFLLKTSPLVNYVSINLISGLLGHSIQIVTDWSDTLALIVLWPSWKLWNQIITEENRKSSYAPLLIGIFACVASSPVYVHVYTVAHISAENENLYAFDPHTNEVAVSTDGGSTWMWFEEYEDDEIEPEILPKVSCLLENQNECYRIDGKKSVEVSYDGGKTWGISWQPPAERMDYQTRIGYKPQAPVDLLISHWQGHDIVIVAVGGEGVLRRELPDGEWQRISVLGAVPVTSFKMNTTPEAVRLMSTEIKNWFLLSILVFVIVCWTTGFLTRQRTNTRLFYMPLLYMVPGFALLFLFIEFIKSFGYSETAFLLQPGILVFLALELSLVYIGLNQWRVLLINNGYPSNIALIIVITACLANMGVFIAGSINWIFWARDMISQYDIALYSAIKSSIGITLFFALIMVYFSRRADKAMINREN